MIETGRGHRVQDILSCVRSGIAQENGGLAEKIPPLDMQVLLAHALGKKREFLYTHPGYELRGPERAVLDELLERRLSGEPVSYITGEKEFYSLTFKVNHSVLIPRPETELLVDEVLDRKPASLLDIGTGSGNIAVSVKHRLRSCAVVACDVSEDALALARENAEAILGEHDIRFVRSNFYDCLNGERLTRERVTHVWFTFQNFPFHPPGRFELIVSNPPYIRRSALGSLQREVRDYEPRIALDGGEDGLDAYRVILSRGKGFLMPGGRIILETDPGILDGLVQLVRETGYRLEKVVRDLTGLERMVVIAC